MTVLAHRVDGTGEPVLLLNGGLMSIASWDAVAGRLAGSCRLVRCDFRGQLRSLALGPPPPAISGHAEDLAGLLDALRLARAHVVGASFGALVALEFAARFPDRVRSLVAVTATDVVTSENHLEEASLRQAIRSAAGGADGRGVLDLLAPYTFSPEWLDAHRDLFEARRAQFALLPPVWYSGLDGLMSAMENLDLRPVLPSIQAPTLVIAAECDRIFPIDRSCALAAAIPRAQLRIVPGAPHGWVGEDPAAFVDVLLPFLSSHAMKEAS